MAGALKLASEFPPVDERQWLAMVEKALKGAPFDRLMTRTRDGIELKPLYTRKDVPQPLASRPLPHVAPWDIRQRRAEADPADANAAILDDLQGGVHSIALAVAAPGQAGLAMRTEGDLARALDGVRLDTAGIWLEPGAALVRPAEAMLALWARSGLEADAIRGGLGLDPLGALAVAGGLGAAPERALEQAVALAKAARAAFPNVASVLVDARLYHDGGASEAQELACLCATAAAYLRAFEAAGVSAGDAFAAMTFALAADADLFLTVAKLRAARLLLLRMAEACGVSEPVLHIEATSSQRMLTRRDPYNNLLRTTIACAGAAIGGADAITVLPFTWPLGQPDAFARRMARNIQLIMQEEAQLGRVGDPAGGSWYADSLTLQLARSAWTLLQDIEARGGMAHALIQGDIQRSIGETHAARMRDVACAREALIGVNAFAHLDEDSIHVEPWPATARPVDAVVAAEPVPLRRTAEAFERLRDAAEAFATRQQRSPKLFLANLGRPAGYTDRAAFAAALFAAGGIETVASEALAGAADAAAAFKASGAQLACLCGSDEVYGECVPAVAQALSAAGAEHIYLAGRPGERGEEWTRAGVGTFLYTGCDMLTVLRDAHRRLGVEATDPQQNEQASRS